MIAAWLLGLLVPPALAEEAPWYLGLPVAEVRLVAPAGGMPEESLDPLLRVRQGDALDLGRVRLDISTLFRAGEFAAVEAELEPWMTFDEDGELQAAVLLTYQVLPSSRVGRVRVQGARGVRVREVLDAARLSAGEVFYPEVDATPLAERVQSFYRRRGFPDAQAEVDVWPMHDGRLEIWVRVAEGEPRRVGRLAFTGELPVSERRLRRIARRAGVEEGEPFSPEAITAAQQAIRQGLADHRDPLHPRRVGWVGARVTPAVSSGEDRSLQVTFHLEAGPRLDLDVRGLRWRPNAKARRALEIDERLRLTRGFLEDAPDRMSGWLGRRGFYRAEAAVALDAGDEVQVLAVDVRRGPRHYLLPHRPFFDDPGVRFTGNSTLTDTQLRVVMEQASDSVIRLHRITDPEIRHALGAARELYRSQGYQDARLEVHEVEIRPRRSAWHLPGLRQVGRAALNLEAPLAVRLHIAVDEGPLTRLRYAEIEGAAVDVSAFEARLARMEGAAFSPQALDQLAMRVVESHRAQGYLDADARVQHHREGPGEMSSVILVRPGSQVLLRSFVARGARHTSPDFLRRELDLTLGEPLTTRDLEGVRRRLYDLGTFGVVTTDILGDGSARDLVINLRERPRWGFELGSGVSTDQGLRGFGRVTRHNLWGLAHRVEFFGLIGLDYRSDSLTDWTPDLTNPEWRAAVHYVAPHFPARRQRLVLDLLLREELQERTWRLARSGAGAAVEARLERTTLRASTRFEQRRLQEVDPGALLPGEAWARLLHEGLPTSWRPQHTLSGLLLHDLRDDPFQPSRGVLLSLIGEWSPDLGGREPEVPWASFAKVEGRASSYLPLGPLLLHLSGEGGLAHATRGVLPLEDRFRLGGTGSLRGFRRDAVGPRNEVRHLALDWPSELGPAIDHALEGRPTRWVTTGGDAMASGTAELLVPLPLLGLRAWEGYAAAAFVDFGQVWLLDPDLTATSESPPFKDLFDPMFRASFGLGLRVSTPVGPLQIDLAANPAALTAQGARRELLREMWEEPGLRAHLSLGTLW